MSKKTNFDQPKNPFGYSGSFRFFYRREKKVFKNLKFRKMIKK